MCNIIQINSVVNYGSTGHIAEDIGVLIQENGYNSYIAYGRKNRESKSKLIRIGNNFSILLHGFLSRIFDLHGFGSYFVTKKFIKKIEKINPDIIHLHNVHGYYMNVCVMFKFLLKHKKNIVWTFHDVWPITGHCTGVSEEDCQRWQTGCFNCPKKKSYPKSFFSNCEKNYKIKKNLFTNLENLVIVTPSEWLASQIKKSYLKECNIKVINNGINLNIFKPSEDKNTKKIILGVANVWEQRKGFTDFIKLSTLLANDEIIVLVGITKKQKQELPPKIQGIERTENQEELAKLYSQAIAFVNMTYEDNFPTTNLEALACGTPVITYNTGGSPEAIDEKTGFVVEQGDIEGVYSCICEIEAKGKDVYSGACVARAKEKYDKNLKYQEYIDLYKSILNCQE